MRSLSVAAGLLAVGVSLPLHAQDVTLGGQLRPRFEYREPVGGGDDAFTSMRTRLNLAAVLERNIGVFVQLQDVRLFGEETSTLADFSADHLDLHQAYVNVEHSGDAGFAIRVGRQEVTFGGQRLVGPVGWTQQGRSFDGARGRYDWERGSLDFFGFRTAEASAGFAADDADFSGAYAQIRDVGSGSLDLYGLYRRALAADPAVDTKEGSVGARYVGTGGRFTYRVEGTYQFGDRGGEDVAAFMLGGRIGTAVTDRATVTLWYDYLSGDDDPIDGTLRTFNTLFATNHKFYGLADLFLDVPLHTGGYGLQDLAVKGAYRLQNDVSLGADLHEFLFAKAAPGDVRRIGEELDLTVSHRYSPNLLIQGGYSYVVAGTGFQDLGRLGENMQWLYLMMNATF